MEKLILYGAGKRGVSYAQLLLEHGIEIDGFCDSYKTGDIVFESNGVIKKKTIFKLNEIDRAQCSIIITISDSKQSEDVCRKIREHGINVTSIEQIISKEESIIEANRKYIAEYHVENMNEYFNVAESIENLNIFWEEESLFYKMFKELNLERIVELACGRGRHVQRYITDAKEIVLVDVLEKNIDYCRKRFSGEDKIKYYTNNGYDLSELISGSCTSLFTYDAMVHFEMLDVFQYLKETKRILVRGGKGLFHHSNNTENYKINFTNGKYGRNYMSKQLFAYLANRAGLTVIEQHEINWSGEKNLDCITLVGNY